RSAAMSWTFATGIPATPGAGKVPSGTCERRPGPRSALLHRIQLPVPWHTFQGVDATVSELDSGPGDQVRNRARAPYFARPGGGPDARADVDGDAADIVADQLAFAGVEAGAYLDPELAHRVASRTGAADRARGPIEGGEKAVAHRLHRAAPVALELPAHERVVAPDQIPPAAVAERGGLPGGLDDVGEHHGGEYAVYDLRRAGPREKHFHLIQDRVGVTVEPQMVLP